MASERRVSRHSENVRYVLLDRQTGEILDEDMRRLVRHYSRVLQAERRSEARQSPHGWRLSREAKEVWIAGGLVMLAALLIWSLYAHGPLPASY